MVPSLFQDGRIINGLNGWDYTANENVVMKKMITFAYNNEKSLEQLARLLNISTTHGWKSRLAKWFGVEKAIFSNWLKRGIPKKVLKDLKEKGYPPEKWLTTEPDNRSLPVGESAVKYRPSINLNEAEQDLIEGIRAINPDKARGLYGMAKIQLEMALKDKEIKKNKRKKELLERAINSLDKAINEF